MNEPIRSLVDAANDDFDGATSDELTFYCEQLHIPVRSNSTDAWKLTRLREAISVGAHTGTIESKVAAPRNIQQKQLNLKPVGRWEGRRRRINIHESEHDVRSSWKEISWDQNTILVHTGMDVSIPYPHYEILKNAVHEHVRRDQTVGANGQIVITESIKHIQTMPFADLGDDPETAHLPRSWIERQQKDCRDKNYYKGAKREHLTRLYNEMVDGSVAREVIHEWSDEEVREQVINKLGLYEEVQATDFYLDNAA
jgi:hypothetical protein